MRRARRLVLAAAIGAMLLSGGEWRAARAAIIPFHPGPFGTANFTLTAFAFAAGSPNPVIVRDDFYDEAPPGFTSFTTGSFVQASHSGTAGTATARAAGSAATTFSLIDDVLTVQSTASLDAEGRFAVASMPEDVGGFSVGGGDFRLLMPIKITDRQYAYSFSGEAVNNVSGLNSSSRAGLHFGSRSNSEFLNQDERYVSGSHSVLVSGSGALGIGDYTLDLILQVSGGADYENPGPGVAGGSFNFQLTLRPACIWKDPVDGSFQTASKWTGQLVPGPQDVAIFDKPGTYTVRLDQAVTNHGLQANGAGVNVTLDLNGLDYTADEFQISDDATVTFEDTGGPVVSVAAAAAGAALPAAAAAGGSAVGNILTVDRNGRAVVKVPMTFTRVTIDKGTSTSAGSSVSVQGTRAVFNVLQELKVGVDGEGILIVSGGGEVSTQGAVLGENAGGLGLATVTGSSGRSWETQSLVVGKSGGAQLNILDGATVIGRVIVVASEAGSTGVIVVNDFAKLVQSSPNLADGLTIGENGGGNLSVSDNSLVEANQLTGRGQVDVSTSGQIKVRNFLDVAMLTIDHGRVDCDFLSAIVPGSKIIIRNNGLFHTTKDLVVNGELGIDSTASASVGQFPIVNPGFLTIGPGGTLSGNGRIRGLVDEFPGSVNNFQGMVLPGISPGTLTIDGDYEQTGGLLGIEIAGTTPGQFDVLKVMGDVSLGGDLVLEFIDGFAPRQGDVFEFLDVGGALSGAFASVEVRHLLPGFQFDLRPDAGGLTMVALNDGVFVPEPGLVALLLPALIAVRCARKRR